MNERKKTLQNCWAVRKRKAPLPPGAAGEKPGALAGDGVGQGLPSSPGIQDRKPTLDSEPRWVSPTKGQKRV